MFERNHAHVLLSSIYESGFVHDKAGLKVSAFPSSIPVETGFFLHEIVLSGCERTLEVGMAYGLSTLFICEAHRQKGQGTHIAIDPFQATTWQNIGKLNIERAELSKFLSFYEAPSDEVLPRLVEAKEKVDISFIDGNHLFDYTLLDFFYIDKLLILGGLAWIFT